MGYLDRIAKPEPNTPLECEKNALETRFLNNSHVILFALTCRSNERIHIAFRLNSESTDNHVRSILLVTKPHRKHSTR